jgi:hypothetical protein
MHAERLDTLAGGVNRRKRATPRAYTVAELSRVCRMYRTNLEAATALGVNVAGLAQACQRHDVATPAARRAK